MKRATMPDRYLRAGLLMSDTYDALSVEARELFVRLLLVVDDFGCYDGRDHIVANNCYPLRHHDVSDALRELHNAGLIVRYSNRGKGYLAIRQWGELLRKTKRRFPAPPINVDLPKIKYRGPFNRPMDWANPDGCDHVSVLIDTLGRAVVPQPPEWRRHGDLLPLDSTVPQQSTLSLVRQPLKAPQSTLGLGTKPDEEPQALGTSPRDTSLGAQPRVPAVAVTAVNSHLQQSDVAVAVASTDLATPSLTSLEQATSPATATPMRNGKIELLESGEWRGVTEVQRLRWQGMFAALSIPDQLDRAGAWLLAHPAERAGYERDDGLEAFLIRWLLREARSAPPPAH